MRSTILLTAVLALAAVACGPRFEVEPVPAPAQDSQADAEAVAAGHVDELEAIEPPQELAIPAIGVHTSLIELGLNADRTVEVPEDAGIAGWYTGGPKPGETGPAALIGHVDSRSGPGVFYRLPELSVGDEVLVRDRGGTVVRFVVEDIEQYPKDAFPTERVYGDTEGPELRLITCGGAFDPAERSYRDNIVVFARAVTS